MTDLTVPLDELADALPPDQLQTLADADAHLADVLDDFAFAPGAFDEAWAAAHPTPVRTQRWAVGASLLVGLAVAATLALVLRPEVDVEPVDATPDEAAASEGCSPDGLELAAHQGALGPRNRACMERLVAEGTVDAAHADRLRLVDLWNRGDVEGWQDLASEVALSDDGDADLAYKLLVQLGALGDPELILTLADRVEELADDWPEEVRSQRLEHVERLREAALRLLDDHEDEDLPPLWPPSPPPTATTGRLSLRFAPRTHVQKVQIRCENLGERIRGVVYGDSVTLSGIPMAHVDTCYATLLGPEAPRQIPVAGGQSLLCETAGDIARCQPDTTPPLHSDQVDFEFEFDSDIRHVEVACKDLTQRWYGVVVDRRVRVDDIPVDTRCFATFVWNDGSRSEVVRVLAGQEGRCRFDGTTPRCDMRDVRR